MAILLVAILLVLAEDFQRGNTCKKLLHFWLFIEICKIQAKWGKINLKIIIHYFLIKIISHSELVAKWEQDPNIKD